MDIGKDLLDFEDLLNFNVDFNSLMLNGMHQEEDTNQHTNQMIYDPFEDFKVEQEPEKSSTLDLEEEPLFPQLGDEFFETNEIENDIYDISDFNKEAKRKILKKYAEKKYHLELDSFEIPQTAQEDFRNIGETNNNLKRKFVQPFQELFDKSNPCNINFPMTLEPQTKRRKHTGYSFDSTIEQVNIPDIIDEFPLEQEMGKNQPLLLEIPRVSITANGEKRKIFVSPKVYSLYLRKNKLVKISVQYNPLNTKKIIPGKVLPIKRTSEIQDPLSEMGVELVNVQKLQNNEWVRAGNYEDVGKLIVPFSKGYVKSEKRGTEGDFNVIIKLKLHEKNMTEGGVLIKLTYRLHYQRKFWTLYYVFRIDSGKHNSQKISLKKVETSIDEQKYQTGKISFLYDVYDDSSALRVQNFDPFMHTSFTPIGEEMGNLVFCCVGNHDLYHEKPDFWKNFGISKKHLQNLSPLMLVRKRRLIVFVIAHGLRKEGNDSIFSKERVTLIQPKKNFQLNGDQMAYAKSVVTVFDSCRIVFFDINDGTSIRTNEVLVAFRYLQKFADANKKDSNVLAICPFFFEYSKRINSLDKIFSNIGDNVLVVNSAGNESKSIDDLELRYPHNFAFSQKNSKSNILTVGTFDFRNKKLTNFSNFGKKVALYSQGSSTSYSCLYTGMISSILWSLKPEEKGAEVIGKVLRGCSDQNDLNVLNEVGVAINEICKERIVEKSWEIETEGTLNQQIFEESVYAQPKLFDVMMCYDEKEFAHLKELIKKLQTTKNYKYINMIKESKIKMHFKYIKNEIPKIKLNIDYCLDNEKNTAKTRELILLLKDFINNKATDKIWKKIENICCCYRINPKLEIDDENCKFFIDMVNLIQQKEYHEVKKQLEEKKKTESFPKEVVFLYSAISISLPLNRNELLKEIAWLTGCERINNFSMPSLFKGLINESIGEKTKCLISYDHAEKINPSNPEVFFAKANHFFSTNLDQAEMYLNRSLLCDGNFYPSLINKIVVMFEKKDKAKMKRTLDNTQMKVRSKEAEKISLEFRKMIIHNSIQIKAREGKIDECIDDILYLQSIDPCSSYYLNLLGVAFYSLKKFKKAKNSFMRGLKLNPQSITIRNNLGVINGELGNNKESMAFYQELVKEGSATGVVFCNMAKLFWKMKDYEKGLKALNVSLSINPQNYLSFKYRGLYYLKKNEFQQAAFNFNSAIKINSNDSTLFLYRGISLTFLHPNAAAKDFNFYIKMNQHCPYGFFYKAVLTLINKGQYDSALVLLNKAIELNPKFTRGYLNRAFVYAKLMKLELAQDDCNKAITLAPKISVGYFGRGLYSYKYGIDFDSSLEDFNQAIKLNGDVPYYFYCRGLLLRDMGLKEKSEKDMKTFWEWKNKDPLFSKLFT